MSDYEDYEPPVTLYCPICDCDHWDENRHKNCREKPEVPPDPTKTVWCEKHQEYYLGECKDCKIEELGQVIAGLEEVLRAAMGSGATTDKVIEEIKLKARCSKTSLSGN